jgi:hypothetical protein
MARNPWMSYAFAASRMSMEASMVIGLRLAKLAQGGPAGMVEAQKMVAEKAAAAVEAQLAAAMALATGGTQHAAATKALTGYRRRVRANRKRLSRKT